MIYGTSNINLRYIIHKEVIPASLQHRDFKKEGIVSCVPTPPEINATKLEPALKWVGIVT